MNSFVFSTTSGVSFSGGKTAHFSIPTPIKGSMKKIPTNTDTTTSNIFLHLITNNTN